MNHSGGIGHTPFIGILTTFIVVCASEAIVLAAYFPIVNGVVRLSAFSNGVDDLRSSCRFPLVTGSAFHNGASGLDAWIPGHPLPRGCSAAATHVQLE